MKINSKHKFKCCDPEQVWDKLMDIDYLSSVISDRKGPKRIGKKKYRGQLPVKMDPIEGKLDTTFKLNDIDKPKNFRLHVRGKNGAIRVSSKGKFKLSKEPDTTVRYEGRLNLGLKLPAGLNAGAPGPVNKKAKKSLEKALASLFRKIDRQCCEENGHAH
ncbi:MAG: SRPBCC domain-containing protein [Chloroflexi bacterium]|nr:SRPBCC domain-containing protein [Chloroflexota bacterium]